MGNFHSRHFIRKDFGLFGIESILKALCDYQIFGFIALANVNLSIENNNS